MFNVEYMMYKIADIQYITFKSNSNRCSIFIVLNMHVTCM